MQKATLHILLSLADGPQHGYGIKQDVEERTAGTVRLGSGTLYEAIQRLEQQGWIRRAAAPRTEAGTSGGPPRRYYALTRAGRRAVADEVGQLADVVRFAEARDLLTE